MTSRQSAAAAQRCRSSVWSRFPTVPTDHSSQWSAAVAQPPDDHGSVVTTPTHVTLLAHNNDRQMTSRQSAAAAGLRYSCVWSRPPQLGWQLSVDVARPADDHRSAVIISDHTTLLRVTVTTVMTFKWPLHWSQLHWQVSPLTTQPTCLRLQPTMGLLCQLQLMWSTNHITPSMTFKLLFKVMVHTWNITPCLTFRWPLQCCASSKSCCNLTRCRKNKLTFKQRLQLKHMTRLAHYSLTSGDLYTATSLFFNSTAF